MTDSITIASIGVLTTTVVSAITYVVYWSRHPHELVSGEPVKVLPESAEDRYYRLQRDDRALALAEYDERWLKRHGPGIRENRQRDFRDNPYEPTFTQVLYGLRINPGQVSSLLDQPMSGFQAQVLAQQYIQFPQDITLPFQLDTGPALPPPQYSPLGYSRPPSTPTAILPETPQQRHERLWKAHLKWERQNVR